MCHVLNIDDYFPELAKLTIPTIELFAKRIGATLNVITERRFDCCPVLTEKLQIYELGMGSEWNLFFDLDVLIHPKCRNPTDGTVPITHCAFKDTYDADTQLATDAFFQRDGRNVGVSSCVVMTSRLTHDLWKPISDLTIDQINDNILQERKIVDEYTLSRNLAKYGLRYTAVLPIMEYNNFFHLGAYGNDKNIILDKARQWHKLIRKMR